MKYEQFGIDAGLAEALGASDPVRAAMFDRIMETSAARGENLCIRMSVSSGREELLLMPIFQVLKSKLEDSKAPSKALYLVPDEAAALAVARTAERCRPESGFEAAISIASAEVSPDAGDARLLVATSEGFLAAVDSGLVRAMEYDILALDGGERIAELPEETLHALAMALVPSWERRTFFACSRLSTKAKNLAWDLARNPSELHLDERVAKAQGVSQKTWRMSSDAKARFLLGFLEREKCGKAVVFCNLEQSAVALAFCLVANGVDVRHADRMMPGKRAAFAARFAPGVEVTVLSDSSATRIPVKPCAVLVNFDIPLESEAYLSRLDWLDRDTEGAFVANLACERYDCGLSGIERLIESNLSVAEADSLMLEARDYSIGAAAPGERSARERHESHGHGERRDGYRGPESSIAPDIRKTIAEATGGSLRSANMPEQRERKPDRRERKGSVPLAGSSAKENPRDATERRSRKQAETRRPGRTPSKPVAAGRRKPGMLEQNPYEMSAEERMKVYKEKYGIQPTRTQTGLPSRKKSAGQQGQAKRPDAGRNEVRGKNPSVAPKPVSAPASNPAAPPSSPPLAPKPTPDPKTGSGAQSGLWGRLAGLFRKKDD